MLEEVSERYKNKIKSALEIRETIGDRPRERKAIMCHGVFDVVHPGHIRHLLYAKSKGEILIASLTADKHIDKGLHRPHVPQDLRALNLATFDLVDYVLIDNNATPLENLEIIQPDFFAKGYEYSAKEDLPIKTQEEITVIESYGGEVLFTPGDIVYSSTNLIDLAPPQIGHEKLLLAMERGGVSFDMLRDVLRKMSGKRVHVVGDTIVDTYSQCAMIGGQTKTPTMSVLFQGKVDYVGGAGIVAKHLRAAGAEVVFSTVLGEDGYKQFVLDDLQTAGVECRAYIDDTRPTVNKNAIVAGGYRLLKIDTLDNSTISDRALEFIVDNLATLDVDSVVFSDFRHGLFNRRTIPTLTESIPKEAYKVADSQVASRWGNITDFVGFDMITPNEREARFALADQDSGLRPLASAVYDMAQCGVLILKLGERGVLTCTNANHEDLDSFFVIDSFVDQVVDAVGAGDALLAYSTMGMLACNNAVAATILGSVAAACECEFDGNIPITPENVLEKIDRVEKTIRFEQ